MDARLDPAKYAGLAEGSGSTEGNYIDWLTIADNARSVIDDVQRIRNHPLVPTSIPVYSYIYDVKSGRLNEVSEASEIGRASRYRRNHR